jgi:DNA-binding transcriptional ArsR family regulator
VSDLNDISSLDRVIHEPARLALMSILYAANQADFLYLLRESGLTKGNLSAHLGKLEAVGYIEIEKGYVGKLPQTLCRYRGWPPLLKTTQAHQTVSKSFKRGALP